MLESTIPTLMSSISVTIFMAMVMVYTFNYLFTKSKWLVHHENINSSTDHLLLLHGDDHVDCAVCLSKLSAGETFRVLKSCNHGFHAHCIDAWLKLHSTCPLCRTNVPSSSSAASSSEHEGGVLISWSISLLTSISEWMENISLNDELKMAVCANFTSLS
ncbi:hypothetical protein JRO89_XS09G0238600 [Xanthoceras sorbifolium]|uniref:RING-type domain-containing protein n=1 Tax=Xanthoceras sorbifolium TaxID=99658 RepID=A0ABQ8HMZ2_9ROSI|nr:hypothetical protein JRO89_XS09G0238600 [Xanthoceras sorbifolium]